MPEIIPLRTWGPNRCSSSMGTKKAPALREQPGAWTDLTRRPIMSKRICSIDGCGEPHSAKGYCVRHYNRHAKPKWTTSRVCTLEGCDHPHEARGWCKMHYQRWQKHGDPHVVKSTLPPEDRVLDKFLVGDGCWEWTGAQTKSGYGNYSAGGRNVYAHRFVYEWLVGPIPDGLTIDHLCFNRTCVNPDHLEPVTLAENGRRGNDRRAVAT